MTQVHSLARVTRFLSAGGIGVLLYYLILYILTDLFGVWYMLSAVIASIVNWTSNFVLQKYWTFQNKDTKKMHLQVGAYAVMAACLFAANLLLLFLIVEFLQLWYLGAQMIVTVLLTITSYYITSRIFTELIDQRSGNEPCNR